ncbi:MAG: hypothetical protein RLZZ450_5298 [Pseudomonadota bacterium]|jgi:hypothetical protein
MHTEHTQVSEADVVHRAYHTLRPLLLKESAFKASVSEVNKRTVRFTRARFVIEQRTIERLSQPGPDTRAAQAEPLITPALDAWQVDREELPEATRQLCSCSSCDSASLDSQATCSVCERAGRVYTWLEVARTQRVVVRATPHHVALHWLPSALDKADFAKERWLHRLEREEVLTDERIAELPPELLPALAENERITAVCAQSFCVEAYDVRYQTAFGTGLIEVAGTPLTAFDVVREPLVRRSVVARSAALLGAIASAIVAFSYREQHPWFAKYGPDGTALLLGLMASLLLGAALLGWLRARPSRTALSTWCPTAGALLLTAAFTALLSSAQPSVADARDALHKRDLERATLTADALSALGRAVPENQALRDDIRLARMDDTRDLPRKVKLASSGPWSLSRQPAMRSVVLQAMEPLAERARQKGDGAALRELSALVSPVLPSAAHALAVEAAALASRACLAKVDLVCIERSAAELGRLGAVALRDRSRQALLAILHERFERAVAAVARSRTVRVELALLTEASELASKLETLGAPLKRSLTVMVERGRARAEIQLAAATAKP